jgi:hypothetical protein
MFCKEGCDHSGAWMQSLGFREGGGIRIRGGAGRPVVYALEGWWVGESGEPTWTFSEGGTLSMTVVVVVGGRWWWW